MINYLFNKDTQTIWILTSVVAVLLSWSFILWLVVSASAAVFINLVGSGAGKLGDVWSDHSQARARKTR